jgi:hypothetical protein
MPPFFAVRSHEGALAHSVPTETGESPEERHAQERMRKLHALIELLTG